MQEFMILPTGKLYNLIIKKLIIIYIKWNQQNSFHNYCDHFNIIPFLCLTRVKLDTIIVSNRIFIIDLFDSMATGVSVYPVNSLSSQWTFSFNLQIIRTYISMHYKKRNVIQHVIILLLLDLIMYVMTDMLTPI